MQKHKKRTYNSDTRDAKALQTRDRILEEAKKLFQSEGFECVTIEKIAQAADVSVPTIYSLFQSKRGILRVIMDQSLAPDQFQALVRDAYQQDSIQGHLAMSAKIARQMYDAESAEMDIFRAAPALAPELKELENERELRRYKRQEGTIKLMVQSKSLAKGMSQSKARDVLWALTGRDMYRMLVIERGWKSEEYETWLAKVLIKVLVTHDTE